MSRPEELVVMSWGGAWGRALRAAVSDPFTAHTGIRVHQVLHVGLELPANLTEAVAAGARPPFDVVWSNGVAAIDAARNGWSEPLSADEVESLSELHPRARPDGVAGWPAVMVYVVPYVLVFRRAAVDGLVPETWEALFEPSHRGRVAIYPDGNGIHPVAQVLGGGSVEQIPAEMEPCWRILRRLRPQVGTLAYSVGMEERLRRGELDLCMRALPNALGFRAAGIDVDWVAPREGVPDTADAMWIPHGVPEDTAVWSRRYIDFALSRRVYECWCEQLGVLPVRTDVALPYVLASHAGAPRSLEDGERILHVPDLVKLECQEIWRARFSEIFKPDA